MTELPALTKNNSLELVAVLISVWVSIVNNTAKSKTCFLALSDNSSAVGWLHKASIDDTKNLPLHMASRKYAEILMGADCCLYSQHIAGKQNVVADYLSRNFDLSEEELTSFVLSNYTNQVPTSFKTSHLPQEILLWLTSWLQKCKEKMGL